MTMQPLSESFECNEVSAVKLEVFLADKNCKNWHFLYILWRLGGSSRNLSYGYFDFDYCSSFFSNTSFLVSNVANRWEQVNRIWRSRTWHFWSKLGLFPKKGSWVSIPESIFRILQNLYGSVLLSTEYRITEYRVRGTVFSPIIWL